ncbi:DUF5610 domain-containing protein [Shewanella japonica]|uniref:DUF5610 domain-containing protein n=1 Tax=Shewanella japonica TaxID=93973 RepID=A0ABN4YEH4_9GAMM|nr:DUF5610 domain-containing protein [Shewanella japonica]ARD21108.1 hypothetical protein SJ2017_0772 [Shewanella japonica]
MEIYNPTQLNAQAAKNQQPSNGAKDIPSNNDVSGSKASISEISRDLKNSSILAAQEQVSIQSGDKSMALLYRAAIDSINSELAPTLGENVIQKNAENEVDYSPEATAERIVSFATNFFSVHQQQNSGMEFNEQLDSFMDIISGAIDQGFSEATEILTGLNVFEGDIEAGVDKTYSLIQAGLETFKQDTAKQADVESEQLT